MLSPNVTNYLRVLTCTNIWRFLVFNDMTSANANYIAPSNSSHALKTTAFMVRHMLPQRTTAEMLISTCLNFVRLRHEQHLCECGNVPTEKKGWEIHVGVLLMFYSCLVE